MPPVADSRTLVLGVGQAALGSPDVDLVLDLGEQHPTSHGLLTLTVSIEGDVIAQADVGAAHLHRGAEKLFEVRDYRQIMVLANRHDWLSAFSGELGVALAVEAQLGLDVPVRATWIRMALAELGRILHHSAFLAPVAGWAEGEALRLLIRATGSATQQVMESGTGGRLHVMATRIGGLRRDVPDGWTTQVRALADEVDRTCAAMHDALASAVLIDRYAGRGIVPSTLVDGLGLSGAVARASGVDLDLRRDAPYLAYAQIADTLEVPVDQDGDALARLHVRVEQTRIAAALLRRCCDQIDSLGSGPIDVLLPKALRVPEGTSGAWVEAPGGASGYVLVSRGDKVPWRLKLRSASFSNASVLPHVLVGGTVDDVVPVLQSMQLVVGDLAK